MNTARTAELCQPPAAAPTLARVEGWTIHEYPVVESSNLVAARLPAWSAVRAGVQTGGRGRFQRRWVSDEGGMWLSAVLPIGLTAGPWRALPLAVGLAVCETLERLGVKHLRMRWPNDILVADRKLAGLLIDQFVPGLAVAGIGINVRNQPEGCEASLRNQTARLADLVPAPPLPSELAALVLPSLRNVVEEMQAGGFGKLLSRVNCLWGKPRRVELDLDGEMRQGLFTGVDEEGRLLLSDQTGSPAPYAPQQVRHLTEITI